MARGYKTGGRQKGTPNKHPIGFRAQLKAYCDAKGIDPHFFLADIIADKSTDLTLRFQAAKELARYIEPQLKAVEHSSKLEHNVMLIRHRYV